MPFQNIKRRVIRYFRESNNFFENKWITCKHLITWYLLYRWAPRFDMYALPSHVGYRLLKKKASGSAITLTKVNPRGRSRTYAGQCSQFHDSDQWGRRLLMLHRDIYHCYQSLHSMALYIPQSVQNRAILRHIRGIPLRDRKGIVKLLWAKALSTYRNHN